MDKSMIDAFDAYRKGRDALKKVTSQPEFETFVTTSDYRAIREYLNIHELIAAGIHNGVFDKKVCRSYWCAILTNACIDVKSVIDHARSLKGGRLTYCELERLNKEWASLPGRPPS